jgi:hypothetical protein
LRDPRRIEKLADRANKSLEKSLANQRIVRELVSTYENAASEHRPKMPRPSLKAGCAEYETFAVRALAELLENAERRSSQLKGELDWLREFIAKRNAQAGS